MQHYTQRFWLVTVVCSFLACSHPIVPPADSGDAIEDAPGLDAAPDTVTGTDAAVADVLEITDSVEVPDVPPDVADVVKAPDSKPDAGPELPLCPEAKGNCANCNLCPAFPICTLKEVGKPELKTYPSDCYAICALQAYNWPQEVGGVANISQGECPTCPLCTPVDMKKFDPQCVALAAGGNITVDHKCEVGCVKGAAFKADGVTIMSASGPCKSQCTDPVASGGGGCLSKSQPVCAKEDNKTYNGECDMQNCATPGCYPIGDTTESAQCVPGKMTKACDGACYNPVANAGCPSGCDPVCGIKTIKLSNGSTTQTGISYANACLATQDGAVPDPLYNGKGCCGGVNYAIVNPVCGSQSVPGKPDAFVTFQNQGEYDCLTKGDPSWTFQYAGACICNCTNNSAPVCSNNFTYVNACQAQCYLGAGATYTPGACGSSCSCPGASVLCSNGASTTDPCAYVCVNPGVSCP